jgi:hypothetical protein
MNILPLFLNLPVPGANVVVVVVLDVVVEVLVVVVKVVAVIATFIEVIPTRLTPVQATFLLVPDPVIDPV